MLYLKRLKPRTRALLGGAIALVIVAAATILWPRPHTPEPTARPTVTASNSPAAPRASASPLPPYNAPTAAVVAALPEAVYDAVIGGLMPHTSETVPSTVTDAYSLIADTPLYGADKITPVARFSQQNFMLEPTVVVPLEMDGGWALVLTPARQTLPSASGGVAAAQTAAWIRRDALKDRVPLPSHVVISAGAQTLSIISAAGATLSTFAVGVGMDGTPTPTGVLGYIQARYLDPAQGQSTHPIQLTSLHSSTADEPYSGTDGGLIGIHYQSAARGAVSHGCIRLNAEAITAVNRLALGTPVLITP